MYDYFILTYADLWFYGIMGVFTLVMLAYAINIPRIEIGWRIRSFGMVLIMINIGTPFISPYFNIYIFGLPNILYNHVIPNYKTCTKNKIYYFNYYNDVLEPDEYIPALKALSLKYNK